MASQAHAAKADTMDAQHPGIFDKKAFIAAVKAAIEAAGKFVVRGPRPVGTAPALGPLWT